MEQISYFKVGSGTPYQQMFDDSVTAQGIINLTGEVSFGNIAGLVNILNYLASVLISVTYEVVTPETELDSSVILFQDEQSRCIAATYILYDARWLELIEMVYYCSGVKIEIDLNVFVKSNFNNNTPNVFSDVDSSDLFDFLIKPDSFILLK
jgi:hypothetical protein